MRRQEADQARGEQEMEALARRLGHRFRDPGLLGRALRHSSYVHENPEAGASNEQLEFLGDAVLSLTVSNLLLARFPHSSEGELSRGRAALVNARQLAALARGLDLGPHLLLGRGEEQQGGRHKPSVLADALEAVVAAVFLDGGLKATTGLTRRLFTPQLESLAASAREDSKTALQEHTQARYKTSPTYRVVSESGPGHARHFLVEAELLGQPLARGEGRSKKEAEQRAARLALELLRGGGEEGR